MQPLPEALDFLNVRVRAVEAGRRAGLHYIYAGNLPGELEGLEDTKCASCGKPLIRRRGYRILDYRLTPEGACPRCATAIPGRFGNRLR